MAVEKKGNQLMLSVTEYRCSTFAVFFPGCVCALEKDTHTEANYIVRIPNAQLPSWMIKETAGMMKEDRAGGDMGPR
jgi:hypothetical protein